MEKIKTILRNTKVSVVNLWFSAVEKIKSLFSESSVSENDGGTTKKDLKFGNIIIVAACFIALFVVVALFLPNAEEIKFRVVATAPPKPESKDSSQNKASDANAGKLWGNSYNYTPPAVPPASYNTSMLVLPHGGNSKLELHAGTHLKITIVDKFIASQESVPVMAKVTEAATTDSGLSIPIASLLYGEASYQKQSGRVNIVFRKLSMPSGEIRNIAANVVSNDGMPGLEGQVHSDGVKNSAGQIITGFVGGLAAGSMQRDLLGNSTGGITNGLLQATADTAKNQAQKYGESLKESREWIEISSGVECEAIINQSFQMIEGAGTQ